MRSTRSGARSPPHGLGKGGFARDAYAGRRATGPATVIGSADGFPADVAATINGVLGHSLDFDDTHSRLHRSRQRRDRAGRARRRRGMRTQRSGRHLAAVALGNEVSIRIGRAAGGGFHARGFHPTGMCGIFGAVAAAGRLLGADAQQIRNALGIAGSMAGGLLEFLADGS